MAQSFFIHQDTNNGVMGIEWQGSGGIAGRGWTLLGIRLHLDAVSGAVEDLVVMIDGGVVPAVYDTVLLTQAMAAVQDIVWTPDAPVHLEYRDVIDVDWNNGNTRVWGIEIIYETRA